MAGCVQRGGLARISVLTEPDIRAIGRLMVLRPAEPRLYTPPVRTWQHSTQHPLPSTMAPMPWRQLSREWEAVRLQTKGRHSHDI